MTAVPQRTAISHAFGALAAALIGTAEYYRHMPHGFTMGALVLETLLGFLTFTASLMAFGKLQELLPTRPMTYRGQNVVNLSLFGLAVVIGVTLVISPEQTWMFPIFMTLSLLFGFLLIIPIGGADMPTVIALLNSYAGLSASAMGFVLDNNLLIIAGALDGSSVLKLYARDDINSELPMADVALIIGANHVVNPAAQTDKTSPIAGMPILEAYKARTVMVIKRSMSPGFAGIDNDLYYMDKTLMLFGDAKAVLTSIVKELGTVLRAVENGNGDKQLVHDVSTFTTRTAEKKV